MSTYNPIPVFRAAAGKLRAERLLTQDERAREVSAFEDKVSRRQVTTAEEADREIADMRDRYAARRAPGDLPAKGRRDGSASFPDEQAAAGFVKNFSKDSGAYSMKRDGKRVTFKAHPDDHRLAALETGARAWGGSLK
jgi:hypothetical protein